MTENDQDTEETFLTGEILPPAEPPGPAPAPRVEARPVAETETEVAALSETSVTEYFGAEPPQRPIARDDEPYAADNPDYDPAHPHPQGEGMGSVLSEMGHGFDFDAGSGFNAGGNLASAFVAWNDDSEFPTEEEEPETDPLNDLALWEDD